MKRFLAIFLIAAAVLFCPRAWAQNSSPVVGGNISATSTNCSTSFSCVWASNLPANAGTTTIAISGTFSATLLVEESNNGGQTWATAATLSAVGTTTYSTNGFSDIRIRCSAFTSGTAAITISTGLQQVQSVTSGPGGSGITSVAALPATCVPGTTAPVNLNVATPSNPVGFYTCTATNTWTLQPKKIGNTFYVAGYGAQFNGHFTVDAVINSTAVVTSATAHFLANAIVGEDVYTLNSSGVSTVSGAGGVCQILSIDSDTQIHMNCNATTSAATQVLYFGSNDDAAWTALDADLAASSMCNPSILMPAGMSRVTQGHVTAFNAYCNQLDTDFGGVGLTGQGPKSTFLIVGPDYNYTNSWGNSTGIGLQLFSMTGFGLKSSNAVNKVMWGFGNGGSGYGFGETQLNNGISGFSPGNWVAAGSGCEQCFFDQVNAPSISTTSYYNGIFSQNGFTLNGSSITVNMVDASIGQGAGPGINCGAGQVYNSMQSIYYNVTGSPEAIEVTNATCNVFIMMDNFTALSNSFSVLWTAGGTVHAMDAQFFGVSSGAIWSTSATGTPTFIDQGGNTWACNGCTNPLQSYTVGVWGGPGSGDIVYASCTGAVTAATTIGFYGTGTNVTSTACTNTTIGAGIPMKNVGHIYGVIVTVVSGTSTGDVVTVTQNGSNTTFTCTITTSAGCRQMGVAPVATAIADLISVKDVTAVGSTISGMKITVIVD